MRSICFFMLFCVWSLTANAQKDRIALAFEAGTGYAYHDNAFEGWGYHNLALGGEYRFQRLFSADAALRYQAIDGIGIGYSIGNNQRVRAYQRLHAVSLSVGPRLNVPIPGGMELSLAPRVGLMAQKITQPILLEGELYSIRYFKPDVLPVADFSLRWALWLNKKTALEVGANFFNTLGKSREMRIAREALNPAPDVSDAYPDTQEYFDNSTTRTQTLSSLNATVGIRTRLGQKQEEKPRVAYEPFEWGILLGGQVNIPNLQTGQQGSGFHLGAFGSFRWRERLYVQIEPQVKYGPGRSATALFEDYIVTPLTFGYTYTNTQLRGLTNLELPILLKFVPRAQGRSAWLLGVRPAVIFYNAYIDSGSFTAGSIGLNDFKELDYQQALQREDVGFCIGHEYALSNNLRFSIRYTQGIFDLTHDNYFKDDDTYTNSDLQFSLRLLLQ